MYTVRTLVTPEMAAMWLRTSKNNRKIKVARVERLADDIRCGRWRETHQGIAFSISGVLIDGQHRLRAIVVSGIAIMLNVTHEVDDGAVGAVDIGAVRSAVDLAHYHGLNLPSTVAAAARIVATSQWRGNWVVISNAQVVDQYIRSREYLDFAYDALQPRIGPFVNGCTVGIWARAAYTSKRDDLQRAASLMISGDACGNDPRDTNMLLLHRQIASGGVAFSGGKTRIEGYRKTEMMLHSFLSGIQRSKVTAATREMFPVPGDDAVDDAGIS